MHIVAQLRPIDLHNFLFCEYFAERRLSFPNSAEKILYSSQCGRLKRRSYLFSHFREKLLYLEKINFRENVQLLTLPLCFNKKKKNFITVRWIKSHILVMAQYYLSTAAWLNVGGSLDTIHPPLAEDLFRTEGQGEGLKGCKEQGKEGRLGLMPVCQAPLTPAYGSRLAAHIRRVGGWDNTNQLQTEPRGCSSGKGHLTNKSLYALKQPNYWWLGNSNVVNAHIVNKLSGLPI